MVTARRSWGSAFGTAALALVGCNAVLGLGNDKGGLENGEAGAEGGSSAGGTTSSAYSGTGSTSASGSTGSTSGSGSSSASSASGSTGGTSTSSSSGAGSTGSSSGSSSTGSSSGSVGCVEDSTISSCRGVGAIGYRCTQAYPSASLLCGNPTANADGSLSYCCGGTAPASSPPSCAVTGPGTTNCGAEDESCCTSPAVPGGTYYRTYSNNGSGPTGTADQAAVSSFSLDKYMVTVGRFRRFVAAWNNGSGWVPSAGSGKHAYLNAGKGLATAGGYESGWDATNWNNPTDFAPSPANLSSCTTFSSWTDTPSTNENLPITCVTWYEAYAFCIWDGGFLPSEAEWEYAAAGGSQQREYPWGSTAPGVACPGTGCEYAIYNCDYPNGTGNCSGLENLAPVATASMGAARWGQLDLAGNAFEWILDWSASSYINPCTDCANLASGVNRVVRGEDLFVPATKLVPSYRDQDTPVCRECYNATGLRCARGP